jgi:hypothetical protein
MTQANNISCAVLLSLLLHHMPAAVLLWHSDWMPFWWLRMFKKWNFSVFGYMDLCNICLSWITTGLQVAIFILLDWHFILSRFDDGGCRHQATAQKHHITDENIVNSEPITAHEKLTTHTTYTTNITHTRAKHTDRMMNNMDVHTHDLTHRDATQTRQNKIEETTDTGHTTEEDLLYQHGPKDRRKGQKIKGSISLVPRKIDSRRSMFLLK